MFLGDFHLHSQFSDGVLTIPQLVDLMGKNGIGAIAVTDHLCEKKSLLGQSARWLAKSLNERTFPDYLKQIKEESQRAWELYKMVVLPGVEITKNAFSHKNSAHILALDIHEYIDPDLSIVEIIEAIHKQGGIAIAAHPVDTGKKEFQTKLLWEQREILENYIDVWEVASGGQLFPQVQSSSLRKIANSDLHYPQQIDSWKTVFTCEKTAAAIKHSILQQTIDFQYFSAQKKASLVRIGSAEVPWAIAP
jgi:3',5'-nucleoside bisphosphate phosphatase